MAEMGPSPEQTAWVLTQLAGSKAQERGAAYALLTTRNAFDLTGVSSRTLSERLKELEALGLVHRRAYAHVPLHVEYTLTEKGNQLLDALLPLLWWASREMET